MMQRLYVVSGLILALAFVGCASSGKDRSKATVASLKETHEDINAGSKHVDAALAALNSLQYGPDLDKKFDQYKKEVSAIESDAKKVKQAAADMHARSAEYIKKWQAEMDKTGDAALKEAAASRRAAIQSRFGEITAAYDAVGNAYETFHNDLVSLRTYLSNDLTEAGVKASAPAIQKANADAQTMRQKTAAYRAILRDVAGDMKGSSM